MSKEFKAKPGQLLPEIGSILLAGVLTYGLRISNAPIETITIFPETAGGITLNASIFVILMAATGTMMYLFVRFGLKRIVRYLINLALFALLFFLFTWYGTLYADYLPPFINSTEWLLLSLIASIALGLSIYKSKGVVHLIAIVLIGGMTGTFLGVSIPPLTAIALLLGLSAYDLFAVYKGPIGKMAKSTDLEEFTGAVFTYGDLTVGMGDMVFYSMLASNSMKNFDPFPFPFIAASIGLVIGAYLGFKMLEGRDMFPGLPFAVILGLAFMYATSQILTLLRPA